MKTGIKEFIKTVKRSHKWPGTIREANLNDLENMGVYDEQKTRRMIASDTWAFIFKDNIEFLVGVHYLTDNTLSIWAQFNDEILSPIFCHRMAVKNLTDFFEIYSVSRMQAMVDSRNIKNKQWLKKIGFKKESVLKEYGASGQDYLLYRMIKNV